MSTRAVVAVPHGTSWRGRYTHWDGHPTHHVPTLLSIVQRDGLARAVDVLTVQHFGWSSLDDTEAGDGPGALGARSVRVPGYGDAYTTVRDQSRSDDWVDAEHHDTWCLYAYVMTPDGLVVLARAGGRSGLDRVEGGDGGEVGPVTWTETDRFAWTTRPADAHLLLAARVPGQHPEGGTRRTRAPAP